MAVLGDLKDLGLASLIQTICLDGRKAIIHLKYRQETGFVAIQGGQVVHAVAGELEGDQAVYRLLSWTQGSFWLSDHIHLDCRTVKTPWSKLLLQGMHALDERSDAATVSQKILSAEELQSDAEMENSLVLFLSRLEQALARLTDKDVSRNPVQAIQMVAEMVNRTADFSEGLVPPQDARDTMAEARVRASEKYPAARLIQVKNKRLAPSTVGKLVEAEGAPREARTETARQVGHGMARMMDFYFARVLARFYSPATSAEYEEAITIFLNELSQVIDRVQFN